MYNGYALNRFKYWAWEAFGMNDQEMKGFKDRKRLLLLLAVFIGMIVAFALMSYSILIKDLKADLGNKAEILAVDITHWLYLDRQEYDRLLTLDFNQVLQDPTNIRFETTARTVMEKAEVKYVYLINELPEEQAKYRVEAGEAEAYGQPEGTGLTGVYILDAVLSDALRLEDTKNAGYTDKDRYTVLRPEVQQIVAARKAAFLLNTDEWGTYLTGFAPYYTSQGEFLGMLGVDLFPDKYYAYVHKSMTVFIVFVCILFGTGLAVSKLLVRMWRAEERVRLESELATTDALTGLINRRRFVGLLAHEYAVCRREGMALTLILADLEGLSQHNAVYSAAGGDLALKATAEFLKTRVKRGADALSRFGGDEFALFLHNTEAENAVGFAEALLEDAPYPLSIGMLVTMPEDAFEPEELLRQLEEAVGNALKAGTRKYVLIDETQ